jgi:hypothetical protein
MINTIIEWEIALCEKLLRFVKAQKQPHPDSVAIKQALQRQREWRRMRAGTAYGKEMK